jgi:hypothetical protein
MEHGGVVELPDPLWKIVAGPAPLFLGHPVSHYHVSMAL